MDKSRLFYISIIYLCTITTVTKAQLLEGLYCGKENCYDILGVTREATKTEISKNYRQLAKKYHPDLHRTETAKKVAEEQFKIVATAYEILKDEETRADYDYMLDHPDEYYAHYYRYYRRRVAPKVDVRIVLAVTITIISVIQYYGAWQRYEEAIKYFMTLPKYRNKAMDYARQEGLLNEQKRNGTKRKNKTEQKEELEAVIRRVIEENMDIKGSYAKPQLWDVLWIQILVSPYTLCMYLIWYFKWIYKFNIMRQPYGMDEKLYLIRKYMKMGQHQFNGIDERKKQEYLDRELWMKEKFVAWQKEEEENLKKSLAENPKYKAYRRYLKNHGVGRMTFDDS